MSEKSIASFKQVLKTYREQSQGWKERNVFQRQWVFRDFKKQTGMSVDEMLAALNDAGKSLMKGKRASQQMESIGKLGAYYKHQQDLLRGFEKDQKRLDEGLRSIQTWIDEVQGLVSSLE